MSQSTLMSDIRAALEIGQSEAGKILQENPLLETILSFHSGDQFLEFITKVQELTGGNSLNDVQKLRESANEISLIISQLSEISQAILKLADQIITAKQKLGIFQEGVFEIVPIIKKSNRLPNIEKIQSDYPEQWFTLVNLKLDQVKLNYRPTQVELKAVFGNNIEALLLDVEPEITRYDIKPLSIIPEKAGTVEL